MTNTRQSLLLLAMMSGITLPSCMPGSPAWIDVQLTVTTDPDPRAVPRPRATVLAGETAMFAVADCALHIIPSQQHGIVMLQVRIDAPERDGAVKKATGPLVVTLPARAGQSVTLRVDTAMIAIEATPSRLLSSSPGG